MAWASRALSARFGVFILEAISMALLFDAIAFIFNARGNVYPSPVLLPYCHTIHLDELWLDQYMYRTWLISDLMLFQADLFDIVLNEDRCHGLRS